MSHIIQLTQLPWSCPNCSMADSTKASVHYYGILGTGQLRQHIPSARLNMLFLNKIMDAKGRSEVEEHARLVNSDKDITDHKAAMIVYSDEVKAKQPKLDAIFADVGSDLAMWRVANLPMWEKLEELADISSEGQKKTQVLKRKRELETYSSRKDRVKGYIQELIGAVRASDDRGIDLASNKIMAEM